MWSKRGKRLQKKRWPSADFSPSWREPKLCSEGSGRHAERAVGGMVSAWMEVRRETAEPVDSWTGGKSITGMEEEVPPTAAVDGTPPQEEVTAMGKRTWSSPSMRWAAMGDCTTPAINIRIQDLPPTAEWRMWCNACTRFFFVSFYLALPSWTALLAHRACVCASCVCESHTLLAALLSGMNVCCMISFSTPLFLFCNIGGFCSASVSL